MQYPTNFKYTKDHEWALIEGNKVTVGITDHAQSSLGDMVFLDLPKVGRELKAHETFGVVESVKAVSDLFSPVGGKVLEVNSPLIQEPAVLNQDPHGKGWLIKLELTDKNSVSALMDSAAYTKLVESLH